MSLGRARQSLAARFVVSVERAGELFSRYGALAERVAAFCAEKPDRPLVNLPGFTRNEIVWLIHERAAMHLDDLIFRRSQIALDGLCTPALVRELGHLLADERRQNADWADGEIDRCLNNPALSFATSGQAPRGELRHG